MSSIYILVIVFLLPSGQHRASFDFQPYSTLQECNEKLEQRMKEATKQVPSARGLCVELDSHANDKEV
jgi:hypothetical protein